jgi:uncharacterized protein YgfB (UPF0149 family)
LEELDGSALCLFAGRSSSSRIRREEDVDDVKDDDDVDVDDDDDDENKEMDLRTIASTLGRPSMPFCRR